MLKKVTPENWSHFLSDLMVILLVVNQPLDLEVLQERVQGDSPITLQLTRSLLYNNQTITKEETNAQF